MIHDSSGCTINKCIHCSKNLCSCLFSHIGLSGLIVAYTILGGIIFYHIEKETELITKKKMIALRNDTEHKFLNLNNNDNESIILIRNILNNYEKMMLQHIFEDAWNGSYDDDGVNWSMEGAILYSVTVITTIGYGHVTPKTKFGRILTIFYALFGIPLTILYLNNIGDYLAKIFRLMYTKVCRPICRRLLQRKKKGTVNGKVPTLKTSTCSSIHTKSDINYINIDAKRESLTIDKMSHSYTEPLLSLVNIKINCWDDLENINEKIEQSEETQIDNQLVKLKKSIHQPPIMQEIDAETSNFLNQDISYAYYDINDTVPLTLTLLIMVIYIVMGAFLFTMWGDDEDYLKWSYFCFITLSTIGFGDIVPGTTVNSQNPKEKLIVSVLYVAIGLPVFAMCFKLMEDEIVNKMKILARKIGIIK